MKKYLFFVMLFWFVGLQQSLDAQITQGAGGLIGANVPSTNLNVGINGTNPQSPLDVRGEIRSSVPGTGSNYLSISTPGAYHTIRSTNNLGIQCDNNAKLTFTLGGAARVTMMNTGRVGIGTATPSQTLDVIGNTYTSGMANIGIVTASSSASKLHVHNGSIMVSGSNSAGGAMITFSDNIGSTFYPNGRYGIEYIASVGLNFWKPWNPSTGGGANYIMLMKDDHKIGMGIDPGYTTGSMPNSFPSGYRLYVKDGILTEKVKIALYGTASWADYVFADDYKLMPLEEVEAFVAENKHLPNVPSAQALVDGGGIEVESMLAKQMEKIEELTLYIIAQNKKIEALEDRLNHNAK